MKCVLLYGLAGYGKTTLASEGARWWVRIGLFDGAIFLGLDEGSTAESVVRNVGDALGAPPRLSDDALNEWVSTTLTAKRILVIWDNFEQVMPGRKGGGITPPAFVHLAAAWTKGSSALLVVSRAQRAYPVRPTPLFFVTGLSDNEAASFLSTDRDETRGAPAERPEDDRDTLLQLARRLDGQPLALELLASRLASRNAPSPSLATLGELLARAEQEHEVTHNRSVSASLHRATDILSARARQFLPIFGMLAERTYERIVFDLCERLGPDGPSKEEATAILHELADAGLVTVEDASLMIHPLLAVLPEYAPSPEAELCFVATIHEHCEGQLYHRLSGPNPAEAMRILGHLEESVRHAIGIAIRRGQGDSAAKITAVLAYYLERRHRGAETGPLWAAIKTCAPSERDSPGVQVHVEIECIMRDTTGDPKGTCLALERVILSCQRQEEDPDVTAGHASALLVLSQVQADLLNDPSAALATLARLEAVQKQYSSTWQPNVAANRRRGLLGARANVLRAVGRIEEALADADEAFRLVASETDPSGFARAAGRIGHILHSAGQLDESYQWYLQALNHARMAGDGGGIEFIQKGIGDLLMARGELDESYGYLVAALRNYRSTGNRSQVAAVLHSISNLDLLRGNWEAVLRWSDEAEDIGKAVGNHAVLGGAEYNRGAALFELSRLADEESDADRIGRQAKDATRRAITFLDEANQATLIVFANKLLARITRYRGEWDEAARACCQALKLSAMHEAVDRAPLLDLLDEIEHRQAECPPVSRERLIGILDLAMMTHMLGTLGVLSSAEAFAALAPGFLEELDARFNWLAQHFRALAHGADRPDVYVPRSCREIVIEYWDKLRTKGAQ